MHFILLGLGLIGVAAGAALIAVNLPVDQVAIGQMLVVAGMIALAAGAIATGLATANRRLREIAHLLEPLPLERAIDAAGPEVATGTAISPAIETPPKPDLSMPKPDVPAPPTPKPMRDLGDIRPGAPPPASQSGVVPEKKPDARPQTEISKQPPASDLAPAEPLVPPPEPLPPPKMPDFDTVWSSTLPQTHTDPAPHTDHAPPARLASDVGTHAMEASADDHASEAEHPSRDDKARGREAVKVFKSGVIDGMAYALYTDGSIEAELPEGKVRFATVEELRIYLDEVG